MLGGLAPLAGLCWWRVARLGGCAGPSESPIIVDCPLAAIEWAVYWFIHCSTPGSQAGRACDLNQQPPSQPHPLRFIRMDVALPGHSYTYSTSRCWFLHLWSETSIYCSYLKVRIFMCLLFWYEQYHLFEFKGAVEHFPLKKPPDFVSLSGRTSISCLNLRGQQNTSPLKNHLVLSHIEVRRVYLR